MINLRYHRHPHGYVSQVTGHASLKFQEHLGQTQMRDSLQHPGSNGARRACRRRPKSKKEPKNDTLPHFPTSKLLFQLGTLNLHQPWPTARQGPAYPDLFQQALSLQLPSSLGAILFPYPQYKIGIRVFSVVFTNQMMHWFSVFPVVKKHTSLQARLKGYLKITFYS